jgi:hypothetical protein
MTDARQKPGSIVDAARLIYRTRTPNERQIRRVYQRMKAGLLRIHEGDGEPTEWTTTEQALAEYLATSMVSRGHKRPQPSPAGLAPASGRGVRQSTHEVRQTRHLRDVYRGMWRDYFLAVLLRRRAVHRSSTFQRAVVLGQVAVLGAFVAFCAATVRVAFQPLAAERAAIERWIDEHTDRHDVTRWYPTVAAPDGNGVLVEVEYAYTLDSPRKVHTKRVFRVVGDKVSEQTDDG